MDSDTRNRNPAAATRPGLVVRREEVAPVRWTVEEGRMLLRAEHTGGLFSLLELLTPPGAAPPPHVHEDSDETFHVLEGEYEIVLGDQVHEAGPGTTVYGPRGLRHGFRNVGEGPARMLCVATPGGIESMFEGLARILADPGGPNRERIGELVARHRVKYR
jgi:mannose-6-phosphate isomerase-like protein (cupin superfamily)